MGNVLNKNGIRMPTDSGFRSSLTRSVGDDLLVVTVINNFHNI